jgi:hypothetical protein
MQMGERPKANDKANKDKKLDDGFSIDTASLNKLYGQSVMWGKVRIN